MIVFKSVTSAEEIFQLLELQKINLPKNLSEVEINTHGFVTVIHDYETLKKMNNIEPSIIAKKDDLVIGYLLAMTKKSKYNESSGGYLKKLLKFCDILSLYANNKI